ncbi:MAG: hypothetical protein RBT65_16600 [Methanolobus sp.]|nr:hypothetical protein [Methanolobus sp.]
MNIRTLKIILTFLFGCTFGILMVLSAIAHLEIVASICGVLSVILLVACGILIGEDS